MFNYSWQQANERARINQAGKLVAKVEAKNLLNEAINKWTPIVKEVYKSFLNEKICLVTGGMPVKLREALAVLNLPNTNTLSIWVTHISYAVKLNFKVYVSAKSPAMFGAYMEDAVYIGSIDGLVFTKVNGDIPTFKTDYTVEYVQMARKKLNDAKEALTIAQRELDSFGEHDNH